MVKEIIRDGCQYPRRQSKGASCLHVSTRARPRPSAKHEVIGYKKRIIIVSTGMMYIVMVNPVIIRKSQPFDTEEGCLSLEGIRKTKRF